MSYKNKTSIMKNEEIHDLYSEFLEKHKNIFNK